jgi:hypothetical protein
MIENTNSPGSQEAFLLSSIALAMKGHSTDGLVEAQEARGQRQFVSSDRMPTELRGERGEWEALGFVLGDPDPDDPLFMPATLPEGWKRQAAAHCMWSYLLDQRGRRRVAVFYKAAFYDRHAWAHLTSVSSYVSECVGEGTPVVADDSWATPAAVRAAVAEHTADCDRRIDLWSGKDAAEVTRLRAERRRYEAVIDTLSAAGGEK